MDLKTLITKLQELQVRLGNHAMVTVDSLDVITDIRYSCSVDHKTVDIRTKPIHNESDNMVN